MEFTTAVLCIITGLAVGALVGFTYHKKSEEKKFRGALSESERIIQEAAKKAEIAKAINESVNRAAGQVEPMEAFLEAARQGSKVVLKSARKTRAIMRSSWRQCSRT